MIEERDATVTLTLKLSTRVFFSPIERDRPITNRDCIENAIDSLPHGWLEQAEGEGFEIAYPIDGEVQPEED